MTIEHSIYLAVFLSWIVNALMRQIKNFWFYSLISLPGVFLHECAHAIVGIIFRAGINLSSFTIFPKRIGDYWVLGSVSFSNINFVNAAPVAMAPLLILLFPWFISHYVNLKALSWYELLGVFVATAIICHASIPSTQDFKVMLSKPLGLILWGMIIYFGTAKLIFNS